MGNRDRFLTKIGDSIVQTPNKGKNFLRHADRNVTKTKGHLSSK
jgi:hypothetical protein